jgi:hypothetical protein
MELHLKNLPEIIAAPLSTRLSLKQTKPTKRMRAIPILKALLLAMPLARPPITLITSLISGPRIKGPERPIRL